MEGDQRRATDGSGLTLKNTPLENTSNTFKICCVRSAVMPRYPLEYYDASAHAEMSPVPC